MFTNSKVTILDNGKFVAYVEYSNWFDSERRVSQEFNTLVEAMTWLLEHICHTHSSDMIGCSNYIRSLKNSHTYF